MLALAGRAGVPLARAVADAARDAARDAALEVVHGKAEIEVVIVNRSGRISVRSHA